MVGYEVYYRKQFATTIETQTPLIFLIIYFFIITIIEIDYFNGG